MSRIWLGAILGVLNLVIYDPASPTTRKVNLDGNAVAFLTGIGVKVVYGASKNPWHPSVRLST